MKQKTQTSHPFSIRLTDAERAELERQADKQPLGAFVRARLLGTGAAPRRIKNARRAPTVSADRRALSQALALLGKAELARSLRNLSDAAHLGTLPVSEETETALRSACADVATIKALLMRALGIAER